MLECGDRERVEDCCPGNTGVRAEVQQESRVVVEPADDLGVVPGSDCPVGGVGLPGLVRAIGRESAKELRGRFRGCGVMAPARWRIRQTVAREGVRPSRSRWVRIVSAPASRPWEVSSFRSWMIRAVTSGGVWFGDESGLDVRGRNAVSLTANHR